MSIYTTPLTFAYFFGLLFSLLFLLRAIREERYSDYWLAAVLFLLSMEIQDYTFGFSGINMLWEELNGFPRHFNLAFAPTIYFYLKAQTNSNFRFKVTDLKHYALYAIYFIFNLIIFLKGKSAVETFQSSSWSRIGGIVELTAIYFNYILYFYLSLKLLRHYKTWAKNQFSNPEALSFKWLRNFIYLIILGEAFKSLWLFIDLAIDLPFEQDWWWHLLTVCIITYVGIQGLTQKQYKNLMFKDSFKDESKSSTKVSESELKQWKEKIEKIFKEEKIYLEPELNLRELAKKLNTNPSMISATINQCFGKNFNDFVNEYRIQEFENQINLPENQNYTKLAIAMDCGFNSKATFNRALKKFGR